MKKIISIIILSMFTVMLSGCWDSTEINDREYIFATGIDLNEEGKLIFSAEIPRVNKGSEDERMIYTEESKSFTDFYNKIFLKTDKIVSDRLMQVIILGEEVALDSKSICNLFDEIERSPQINRRVKIVVAKGSAQDIINTNIPNNPIVGRYLSEMVIKLKKSEYQNIYSFDEALLLLHNFGSGLIPVVEKQKDSLKIENTAVMKDYEMVGELNSRENEILMMLINPSSSGMKNITVDMTDKTVSLAAEDVTLTKKIKVENNKLYVNYYVTLYCYVNSFELGDEKLTDAGYLDKVKATALNNISSDTDQIIDIMQHKYKTDLLRIQEALVKFHSIDYQKIKDDYENVFSNADIKVYYNMVIKSTGLIKQ